MIKFIILKRTNYLSSLKVWPVLSWYIYTTHWENIFSLRWNLGQSFSSPTCKKAWEVWFWFWGICGNSAWSITETSPRKIWGALSDGKSCIGQYNPSKLIEIICTHYTLESYKNAFYPVGKSTIETPDPKKHLKNPKGSQKSILTWPKCSQLKTWFWISVLQSIENIYSACLLNLS